MKKILTVGSYVILLSMLLLPGVVLAHPYYTSAAFHTRLESQTNHYPNNHIYIEMRDAYNAHNHTLNDTFRVNLFRKRSWWQSDVLEGSRDYDRFLIRVRTTYMSRGSGDYYWEFIKPFEGTQFVQYVNYVEFGSTVR